MKSSQVVHSGKMSKQKWSWQSRRQHQLRITQNDRAMPVNKDYSLRRKPTILVEGMQTNRTEWSNSPKALTDRETQLVEEDMLPRSNPFQTWQRMSCNKARLKDIREISLPRLQCPWHSRAHRLARKEWIKITPRLWRIVCSTPILNNLQVTQRLNPLGSKEMFSQPRWCTKHPKFLLK